MSMEVVNVGMNVVALVLSCMALAGAISCLVKAKGIVKQRDEALDKYDNLVGVIFSATMEYRRLCDVPDVQKRALMQHAAMCELLFRAGLAGDYREFVENVQKNDK